jgi:hypothetical protein
MKVIQVGLTSINMKLSVLDYWVLFHFRKCPFQLRIYVCIFFLIILRCISKYLYGNTKFFSTYQG